MSIPLHENHRLFPVTYGVLEPLLPETPVRGRAIDFKGVRIQAQGGVDFAGCLVLASVAGEDPGLDGVGLRQAGVKDKCLVNGRQAVVARSPVGEMQDHLADGQECPRVRVAWVDFRRAPAQANDGFRALDVFFTAMTGDVVLPRHEIEVVSLDVVRAALLDGLLLFGQELESQRLDDRFGDLVLQREDIAQVAVVTFGPDVIVARRDDQLRGDPHTTPCFSHAPFQHVAHVEFARDSRHIHVPALVHKGAVA